MHTQFKKAAFLSYLKLAITNIGGLVITPYVISMLGDEEYGLYTLIGAFVGYLSVLDLGLNNAIVRYVAQYKAENNKREEENFLAISLLIYLGIAVLIIGFGLLFYLNVENLFGDTLTSDQLERAKIMLLILILNIAFTLPGGAFTGICTGYESFVFPRWLDIIKYLFRIVLIFVILKFGAKAIGIVVLDTLLNLVVILLTGWFVFVKLKVTIKLHSFAWEYIKDIFGYSIWIFVFGLVYQFQWRTGQMILGTHLSPEVVAVYGIGVMLGVYFTTFGNIINRLILPKAVKSVYEKASPDFLTTETIRIGKVSLLILLFAYGAFIVIGKNFILNWVGETYSSSYWITLLIMTAYLLHISQGYLHAVLDAKKMLKFKTLSFLISSIIGILLGAILSYKYGELGMIIGLTIPLIILYWIVMNMYYKKKLKINIWKILKTFSIYFLLEFVIILLSYLSIFRMKKDWPHIAVQLLIYTFFFVIIMFLKRSNRILLINIKNQNS